MKRHFILLILLAGLGSSVLRAQNTYVWNGSTSSSGSKNGGDFNSKFWKLGTTLSQTVGAYDIAQVDGNPSNSTSNNSLEYIGFNLNTTGFPSSFALPQDVNGNYIEQIGALQLEPRGQLWIGVDNPKSGGGGTAGLVLNGATIDGLENVVIDQEGHPPTAGAPTSGKQALDFTNNVGGIGNGPQFFIQLGTPAITGDNTFVVKSVASTTLTGNPSIEFDVPITETVAGSAINFRGGGTDTVAGAVIKLGSTDSYTGGTILGNSSQTGLADSDGVVLQMTQAVTMPTSGDVRVNDGSTLWLYGGGYTVGQASSILTLNGQGTLNSGQVIASANLATTSNLGALLADVMSKTLVTKVNDTVDLESDSTVTVVGNVVQGLGGTLELLGDVEGAGKLTKAGAVGTLKLDGANTYSGGTEVTAGMVEAANNSALGSASSHVQIDNGAKLQVDAGIQLTQQNVQLAYGGSYIKKYNASESLAGSMSVESAQGLKASLVAGQAGASSLTLTAAFATTAQLGTVTGETANVSGLGATFTAYTLQFNLNPSLIDGNAQISTFNSSSGLWVAAVGGNTGNAADSGFFDESYTDFAAANGVTDTNLANFLGDYGADAATGQTWAILNYDGQFAVTDAMTVPEPATWGYLLCGLGGLLWWQRSKRLLADGITKRNSFPQA